MKVKITGSIVKWFTERRLLAMSSRATFEVDNQKTTIRRFQEAVIKVKTRFWHLLLNTKTVLSPEGKTQNRPFCGECAF